MALGDSDLQLFFQDGVKVVLADGRSFMANLDWPESVNDFSGNLTPGMVVGKPTITYATQSAVLKRDMPMMVDGKPYVCGPVRRSDDGKISVAELNKSHA